MIKINITRYRDFTEEELKTKEQYQRQGRYDALTPLGLDKFMENTMEVEITNEQFEAIRKAVLEVF